MDLREDMTFDWHFAADGRQRYLLKKRNNDPHVEATLNQLLIAPAKTLLRPPYPPYPPSPVIAGIDWSPKESIVRAAKDGDNWPLTWADDDALYTTWGDGTGFVPKVEKKLSPRADTPADRFILMRAPKDKLTQREAWEFFVKLEAKGQPVWTNDITQRGPVFTHPGSCLRSAMTYCAPLKRYLWWQHLPQTPGVTKDRGDTRFTGGFAIYDAPEPWGPWTTAFFTPQWDTSPGEHGDFPAKWMSADGKTLHLVISGDDAFSVRKAMLRLR